jgi:hypothetical protein
LIRILSGANEVLAKPSTVLPIGKPEDDGGRHRERNMTDTEHGVALVRAPQPSKRRLLRLGIAGLLATSALCAASVAQARITQIQILTRGVAFGGYSFPGVGQYEYITGIATGEVNPSNSQNAIITDIQLASPRNANHTVGYRHNFYS